jgi:hypothetical protein
MSRGASTGDISSATRTRSSQTNKSKSKTESATNKNKLTSCPDIQPPKENRLKAFITKNFSRMSPPKIKPAS